jgi:uncharacterized protein (TIGR04222 family)
MDFLFDNPLANLSGLLFLSIYGGTIFIAGIVFYLFKSNLDWTSKLPVPLIPKSPDPFEIAYLRGGENEFARTLVFSLTQKGFLQVFNDGKKSHITLAKTQPNWTMLSPMEREILKWFQSTRETSEIFEEYGLIEKLKPYSLEYEQKIRQTNFLTPPDVKIKTKMFGYLILGAILIVGFYRLIMSVSYGGYNLLFLLGLMAIVSLIFWRLGKTSRISELGKRYLNGLQNAFEKLKDNPLKNGNALNSVDPLLLSMGIFGTGVLVGNGYTDFEMAFNKANKDKESVSASSCSSGCGSSSSCGSSWSSCNSSSSCSSGSSCGGGGCGGGCGGS